MYGAGNIGDDLILESAIQILESNNENYSISFVSFNKKYHDFYHETKKIWGVSRWQKLKAVLNCDILLIAGGTACQDRMGSGPLKGITFWYVEYVLIAKILGKKVILWSIGVDKLKTLWGKLHASLLGTSDLIILRDERSKINLENFVLNKKKIQVSYDLAYCYRKKNISANNFTYLDIISSRNNIVIVNILTEFLDNEKYFHYLKGYILENQEINFVFINSEVRPELDNLTVLSFFKLFSEKFPSNVTYLGVNYLSPSELSEVISKADKVISMRMHFSILSIINMKPIFIISRSDKTTSFAKMNGTNYWDIENENINYEDFKNLIDSSVPSQLLTKNQIDSKFFYEEIKDYIK